MAVLAGPGLAPGQAEAAPSASAADTIPPEVRFMRGMILHHAQALEMSRLVPERTDSEELRAFARRVEVAQGDEIRLMERWLERQGHAVPDEETVEAHARGVPEGDAHQGAEEDHSHEVAGDGAMMAGMLTREEFRELERAEGEAFERLFLEGMIFHHEGAILMVEELLETPHAVRDSEVFNLVTHVEAVQQSEITRMQRMLRDLGDGGGR